MSLHVRDFELIEDLNGFKFDNAAAGEPQEQEVLRPIRVCNTANRRSSFHAQTGSTYPSRCCCNEILVFSEIED